MDYRHFPRDENGLPLNPDLFLDQTEDEPLLQHYKMLHDGLSVVINRFPNCLLREDYDWIVRMLENAARIADKEDNS